MVVSISALATASVGISTAAAGDGEAPVSALQAFLSNDQCVRAQRLTSM